MDSVKMDNLKPMARFPIIATNRIEEAEFNLSRLITDLQITGIDDQRSFQLEMNAVNFGRTSLVYNRFGTDTKLTTGMDIDHAIFVTGMGGRSGFYVDKEPHLISPRKAVVVAPAKQVKIERPKNSEILFMRVSLPDLWDHFEKLTNRSHQGSIIFDRKVNVIKGPGAMLKGLMNYLADGLNCDIAILKIPGMRKNFDDMLMTSLLSLPHNKRDELFEEPSTRFVPGLVRRAEEYMRAHFREPLNISDLTRVCNCSRSLLFSVFRKDRGYTPMEFLTEQRLHSAREQILKSDHGASIASIALDCGFISHSWFSQVYRKRFGEFPSETLRK